MTSSVLAFSPSSFDDVRIAGISSALKANRREVFQIISSIPLLVNVPSFAQAANSDSLEKGLLESRVLEDVMSPPTYGMEGNDIFYPSYFNGVWNVLSTTKNVRAPCGVLLFGGNNTYARAQKEVDTSLNYKCRFVPSTSGIIADREYNVVEIAKAAMGENAVMDVPLSSPNKVSVILTPNGANQILRADLLTLARRSEDINSCEFHCSEVVRQVIGPVKQGGSSPPRSTLLKEIETASLYTAIMDDNGVVNEIRCRQKSSTFLLPSQQDPMAYKMWEATRGVGGQSRPIDVRLYDVIYTRKK